jgi:hypothetical protein
MPPNQGWRKEPLLMGLLGWSIVLVLGIWIWQEIDKVIRNWCSRHRALGPCQRCEEEAAARVKAEAKAEAEAKARRQIEIEDTFRNMSAAKREELTTLVRERAKREDLFLEPGDLEAAVVRMYQRAESRKPLR